LIDFLNSQLPEKHQIKTLTFRNAEQLGLVAFDRKTVYDIYCEGENGEHFIVEMQKASQRFFKDRALFWTSFPIRNQAPKGKIDGKNWDFELKTIYLIAILDFEYDEEEEDRKFVRDVQLKDQDGKVFYDKLRFKFLQMPLFTKTESELQSRSDKWHYFLKNLDSFDSIPSIFREPVFERALETAEIARLNEDEAFQYELSRIAQWDNYSTIETAKFQGRAEGLAEGRAEGRAEGEAKGLAKGRAEGKAEGKAEGRAEGRAEGEANKAIEIARGMKQKGFEPAAIAELTGLSLNKIKQLKSLVSNHGDRNFL
jgi:predicted transposase/invertase (TIGR01784 family)